MRRNASRTNLVFQRELSRSGNVREVAPAAGRVVARGLTVGRGVDDVDDGRKQHAPALAVQPRAHALAGDRAGDQDDLPVQPRQHPAAGRGLVDDELDEIAWTRHPYSPTSAGSCARSRSNRVLSGRAGLAPGVGGHTVAKWPEVVVGLRVELGQQGLARGGARGVDQAGIERRQIGQDALARLAACAFGARPQPIERPHDLVEHIVGQPQGRPALGEGRAATERREPADRPRDMRRQSFTPPRQAPARR